MHEPTTNGTPPFHPKYPLTLHAVPRSYWLCGGCFTKGLSLSGISKHQPPYTQKMLTRSKIAKSTRSRWLKKFSTSQSYIRAQLYLVSGPDKKTTGTICSLTWQHLRRAFPDSSCVMTAFQRVLQSHLFDHRMSGLPIYHRALSDWLRRILITTRNGTAISDDTSFHHFCRPISTVNSC